MENETGKASFLGVSLVMIVAVIIIGLAVFAVARGIMNNAQTNFVKTMDGAANSGLSDFDGTTISGVKVRGALEEYEGQRYTILINTAAVQKKAEAKGKAQVGDISRFNKSSLVVREPYGTGNADLNCVAYPNTSAGRIYVMYNAQVELLSTFTEAKEGHIAFEGTFQTVDGLVQYNTQKINWKTSGCSEYISAAANYVCKLIKDPSGTIVGIMFTEVY